MPSPQPSAPPPLPDFESLHTSFHALVSSLVPPSFIGVSRPQLDVEAIKKQERDRRDKARRKLVERGSGVVGGGQEGSSSNSSSTFPQMSDATKRKISEIRSSKNDGLGSGPSTTTTDHQSTTNTTHESSEDEDESRSSVVKKKIKLSSSYNGSIKKKKNLTMEKLGVGKHSGNNNENKEIKNPFKLEDGFQHTSNLFISETEDDKTNSSIDFQTTLLIQSIDRPTSQHSTLQTPPPPPQPIIPSTPPNLINNGTPIQSLPTSGNSFQTNLNSQITTPSSVLSKNQRKKLRKKEKKAIVAGKALQDVVGGLS